MNGAVFTLRYKGERFGSIHKWTRAYARLY